MELDNAVLLGDCLEVLRKIPDNTFHAVVTDPPYGLGQKDPTPEEILAFIGGEAIKTGDFMNNDWDIPSVGVWKEVYRVLKPGGHVLAFGGCRTFDLISLGLRMAGFESRDTIADFNCLQWVHGQGMPKSHNVTGVLTKRGMEAEAKLWEGRGTGLKPSWEPVVVFRKPFPGTVTDNVLKHGTGALNIDGCRVRHSNKKDFEEHKAQVEAVKTKGGVRDGSWKNASDLSGASDVSEAGRWPTNAVLSHHPDCRKVGSKKVRGANAPGPNSVTKMYSGRAAPSGYAKEHTHTSEDGTEIVEAWECAPGCPVAALDEQSGELKNGGQVDHPDTPGGYGGKLGGKPPNYAGDSGGASRFFPQFEGNQPDGRWPPNATLTHHPDCKVVGSKKVDAPVINRFDDGAKPFGDGAGHSYTSTQTGDAEGKEEITIWECVEGCPVAALDEQSGDRPSMLTGRADPDQAHKHPGDDKSSKSTFIGDSREHLSRVYADNGGASRFFEQFKAPDAPFMYTAKPSKRETSLGGRIENTHPTRKPLGLMRWLVRLVTFKGAHVLDPYCGSGTTLHAAAEEGVTYTGIERKEEFHKISSDRMRIVLGDEQERQTQEDAFDLAMGVDDED